MANQLGISENDTNNGNRSVTTAEMTDMLMDIAEVSRAMTEAPTLATADPRFWVVQQRVWHNVPDGCDGKLFVWDANGVCLRTVEDFALDQTELWLEEHEPTGSELSLGSSIKMTLVDGGDPENAYDWEVTSIDEDVLQDDIENGMFPGDYELVWRDWEWQSVPNTMFLTLEECCRHIDANSYHYDHPRAYCMRAWRSPDVKRLWKALKGIDWEKVIELVETGGLIP